MSTFLTKNNVLISGFVCLGLVGGLYYLKKTCWANPGQAAKDNNTDSKRNDTEN